VIPRVYNYFRDYDPATGRYVEFDPVGLDAGVNTYAYVEGNPISLFDAFGLADVNYDDVSHTVTVTDSSGNSESFPAANNAARGSRGAWPAGQYDYHGHIPHTANPDGPYGSNGNFVFNVPGCTGCGIHSGRENVADRAGRIGIQHATEGCFRTTDAATSLLSRLIASGDPIRMLTVVRAAPTPTPAQPQPAPHAPVPAPRPQAPSGGH